MKLSLRWPWSKKLDSQGSAADKERGGGADRRTTMLGHQSRIIQNQVKNFNNSDHRSKMAKWHPFARALTFSVAEILTSQSWNYVDSQDDKIPAENTEEYKKFWREVNLRQYFRQGIDKDQTHGRAFVCRFKDGIYRCYSDEHIRKIEHDERGLPTKLFIHVDFEDAYYTQRPQDFEVDQDDFVLIATDVEAGETYGLGALCTIWDDLLDIAEMDDNLIPFLKQFGSGLSTVHVPKQTGTTEISKIKEDLEDAKSSGKALMIKAPHDKGYGMFNDGKPSVAPDFMAAFEWKVQKICVTSRFPRRWFIGAEQGALSAASEDGLWVIQRLHEIFQKYVPFIKEINKKWVNPGDTGDYDIVPTIEFRQTEEQKAKTELAKTQATMAKAVLDMNQQLVELGYEEKPELAGKYLQMEVMKAANPEWIPPEVEFQQQSPEPVEPPKVAQDTLWEQFQNGMSMVQLVEASGISKPTLYKIKAYADSIQPCIHADSLHLDDWKDDGEYLVNTANIFAPVPLPYPHLKETHMNPADEIQKFADANRGKVFALGYEHPSKDHPEFVQIGKIQVVGFDSKTGKDITHYYVRKNAFTKYNIPLKNVHVSAEYLSQDVPFFKDGIDKLHRNIKLNNVVITKVGRCGPECSLN